MKKVIPFIFFFVACTQQSTNIKRHKADTLYKIGLYREPKTNRIGLDTIVIISRDTISVDSFLHASMVRDTAYFIPNFMPHLDSTRKQMKDSIGRPLFDKGFIRVPDSVVLEVLYTSKKTDSILKSQK